MRLSITITPRLRQAFARFLRSRLYIPTRYEVWNI